MGAEGTHVLRKAERDVIEKLLKEGRTFGFISSATGRSRSCIKMEVARNGGKDVYTAEEAQLRFESLNSLKSLKLSKPLSPELAETIRLAASKGKSMYKIRKSLGISRYLLLKYFKEFHIEHKSKDHASLEERFEILEMQIEILMDQVRELKNRK
jgi:IS30 family transposase